MLNEMMENMTKNMPGNKWPWNMCKNMMPDMTRDKWPWKMCINMMPVGMYKYMMPPGSRISGLDADASPEIKSIFEEWLTQIEGEILQYANGSTSIDAGKIAEHFKLSKETVIFILTRLSKKGKINYTKEAA
jgi:hypothetical protein